MPKKKVKTFFKITIQSKIEFDASLPDVPLQRQVEKNRKEACRLFEQERETRRQKYELLARIYSLVLSMLRKGAEAHEIAERHKLELKPQTDLILLVFRMIYSGVKDKRWNRSLHAKVLRYLIHTEVDPKDAASKIEEFGGIRACAKKYSDLHRAINGEEGGNDGSAHGTKTRRNKRTSRPTRSSSRRNPGAASARIRKPETGPNRSANGGRHVLSTAIEDHPLLVAVRNWNKLRPDEPLGELDGRTMRKALKGQDAKLIMLVERRLGGRLVVQEVISGVYGVGREIVAVAADAIDLTEKT